MTTNPAFQMPLFGMDRLQEAMTECFARRVNLIYCGLTGAIVGKITDETMASCLRLELDADPLIQVDRMVARMRQRQFAMSYGPGPDLRFHKDRHTLVRILRTDKAGPAKLFGYLAGRLLFESLVQSRLVDTTAIRASRLTFLIQLRKRLAKLPAGWHQSLTEADEDASTAEAAKNILEQATGLIPSQVDESKAAQHCLEIMLRLDAVHDIRQPFYNSELKAKVAEFAQEPSWTIRSFAVLLTELEAAGSNYLKRQTVSSLGNAMIVSAAVEGVTWTTKRKRDVAMTFVNRLQKAARDGKLKPESSGQRLLDEITYLLKLNQLGEVVLSQKDERQLYSAMKAMNKELCAVSPADERLKALRSHYKRVGGNERVIIVRDQATITNRQINDYKSAGKAVPAALQAEFDRLEKAGLIKEKPFGSVSISKKPSKPLKNSLKKALGQMQSIGQQFNFTSFVLEDAAAKRAKEAKKG